MNKLRFFFKGVLPLFVGCGMMSGVSAQQSTAVLEYIGPDYELAQSFTAQMKMTYKGDATLSSYELTLKSGANQSTSSGFFLTALQPDGSTSVAVPVSFWPQLEPGMNTIACWVSKVNGETAETASADTLRFEINKLDENILPIRKVLYEGFSSAYCQYCPAFNTKMKAVLDELGDKVVAVKYHTFTLTTADPYGTDYGTSLFEQYFGESGVPKAAVDQSGCPKDQESVILRQAVENAGKSFLSLLKDTVYIDNGNVLHFSIRLNSVVKDSGLFVKAYALEKTLDQHRGSNGETEFYHIFLKNIELTGNDEGLGVDPQQDLKVEGDMDLSTTFMEEASDLELVVIVSDAGKKIVQVERFDVFTSQEHSIALNEKNFPDTAFRNFLSMNVDKNSDGKLQDSEIAATKELNLSGKDIYSLEGIAYLTSLITLDCSSNHLMCLDLSANAALENLDCAGQTRTVELQDGNVFDLSGISGMDVNKVSEVKGGSLDGEKLKFDVVDLSYMYAHGSSVGDAGMEVKLTGSRFVANQVQQVQDQHKVYVENHDICIRSSSSVNPMVEIYDLRGVQVYRGTQSRITMSHTGIYLVKIGAVVKKVVVL